MLSLSSREAVSQVVTVKRVVMMLLRENKEEKGNSIYCVSAY